MRNAFDSKWYDYKTSLALVQTHGRGMRFEEDYCTTYFIDSRLIRFVAEDASSNRFIPDTFRNTIDKFTKDDLNVREDIVIADEGLDFKKKVDLKYEMIQKGNRLLKEDVHEAIKFHRGLLSDELFKHDYYAYQKLAQAYSEALMFEEETETIVAFLKSGIYATKNTSNEYMER